MAGCVRSRRNSHGFSLIELSVVLVIIGLLVGGGIATLEATNQQSRRSDQKRQFDEIREALYGFALSEGRLPCPDDDYPPDGEEDPLDPGVDEPCDADEGALPWQQLGLGRRNPWGHPLRYHVSAEFADAPEDAGGNLDPDGSSFTLNDDGTIRVEDADGNTITNDTPALVLSVAAQGGQVWTDTAFVCPGVGGVAASGFSDDETENCDWIETADSTFVAAGYRAADAPSGRYDDVLIWLPTPVLKARMVDIGRMRQP